MPDIIPGFRLLNDISDVFGFSQEVRQIIAFLARNGSMNIYRISKRAKLKYPTVHRNIGMLEMWRLLKFEREEESEKKGKAKIYGLTLLGLCHVLGFKEFLQHVDSVGEVIERHHHLDTLLMANWSNIVDSEHQEEAERVLQQAALNVCSFAAELYRLGGISKDEDLAPILWNEFSGRLIGIYSEYDRNYWLRVISTVPILHDWLEAHCQKALSYNRKLLEWDELIMKALRGNQAVSDFDELKRQLQRAFEDMVRTSFKNATDDYVRHRDTGFH
jgi:hypothetical protein